MPEETINNTERGEEHNGTSNDDASEDGEAGFLKV